MDRLVPRHRRKAGSGPPANALIAWVGVDPYLREAAATVSYRREMALPLPSHTRSAKAAIAACFVLTCGAVLGITTIISHGRNAAPYESTTPPPRQGSAATPTPDSSPTFRAEAGSDPVLSATPVGMAPALAERTAFRSITVSPAGERIDQAAGEQPGTAPGHVHSGAITAVPPNSTSKQCDPDTATGPATPDDGARPAGAPKPSNANADNPVEADRSAGADKLADSGIPSDPGTTTTPTRSTMSSEPAVPSTGAAPPQRAAGRWPAALVPERLAQTHELMEKFQVRAAAPPR